MRRFNYLLLLLALGLVYPVGLPQVAYAQGNCELGTQGQDLDINNVRARVYNKGNLFYDGGDPNYEVPAGSGISAIFAGGIWVGGLVDDEVRIAAATYAQGGEDYEFYPGPLNDDGTLPDPNDCSQFDRIYKVSTVDIANYLATRDLGSPTIAPDLEQWPTGLGAPTCVDENENGRCDPSDPLVEPTSQDQLIALDENQLPDIKGDQGLWWVMNDAGGPHLTTQSNPIGMEVQVLAFAFARADELGNATFYQYTFKYKPPAGQGALQDTWLTIWSDPDLGNYNDDYIGSDPEIGLGFVYNSDNDDESSLGGYGTAPPALGYDFFLGPTVDRGGAIDTLQMTKFGYYNNNSDARTGNPGTATDFWNYMRGLWRDGTSWTEGGDGTGTGTPVDYIYPNSGSSSNPVPGYWSEVCPQPACANPIPPDDRRFTMSTGPFEMQPGDTQVVTYGIIWARGSSNFASLQAMKAADVLAQRAFDLDFQLAPPPPAPDVEVATLDRQAALTWSYPETSSNYLGSYDEPDPLIAGLFGIEDSTYTFQGFNVYRFPTADFRQEERQLVAVYDKVDGVTTVIDTTFSPEIGGLVPFVAARGEDSGVQFYHLINEQLTNYQDYYYGVSAYAYNMESTPMVLESPTTNVTVRPSDVAGVGARAQSDFSTGVPTERTTLAGSGGISVGVADPTQVTGDVYEVQIEEVRLPADPDNGFYSGETALTYRVLNTTTGEYVFDGVRAYEEQGVLIEPADRTIVVDGLTFFLPVEAGELPPGDDTDVPGFAGGGTGIVEVSTPPNAPDPCEGVSSDPGCQYYGGNTVWLDPNRTGDYVVSAAGNNLEAVARYLNVAAPDDFEMRFTEECATEGNCLGIYAGAAPQGNDLIVSVPFELWNVGSASLGDAEDDVRMIPVLRPTSGGTYVDNWADNFNATQDVAVGDTSFTLPVTQRVLFMMPDREGGYELFAEAARGFGGPGATYDRDSDGDDQVDLVPGTTDECRGQDYYIDFCYKGASDRFVALIGGLDGVLLADLAGDGTTPAAGTTIQFRTVPTPLYLAGDRFTVDTRQLAFVDDDEDLIRAAVERIGVVPNPYRGYSEYESGGLDRRVRFINLPDQATIRIFTLSGTLVRTIRTNNVNFTEWDLETEEGLPVASGMYLVHVETPNGDKVLKLGIVNRESRFDTL